MNSSDLQDLKFDTTRDIVITTRGEELPIKEHNGWRFVNFKGSKIGISKIARLATITCFDSFLTEYVTTDWHIKYPCLAMEYFIHRKMTGAKMSTGEYLKFRKQ